MDKLKKCTKKWNRETEEREGKKKMQDEQKKFQEKLSELLSYARDHENKVTMKEVRDFFEDFALDEQKVTFVCEYLTMEQVDVADYEPGVVPRRPKKKRKNRSFPRRSCVPTAVS